MTKTFNNKAKEEKGKKLENILCSSPPFLPHFFSVFPAKDDERTSSTRECVGAERIYIRKYLHRFLMNNKHRCQRDSCKVIISFALLKEAAVLKLVWLAEPHADA